MSSSAAGGAEPFDAALDEALASVADEAVLDGAVLGEAVLDEAVVRQLHAASVDVAVRAETAAEGQRRVSLLADDLLADEGVEPARRPPPVRLRYPRWGWRRAVRHATQRRMTTPLHLAMYRRWLWHRIHSAARGRDVELHGFQMLGRRVELYAKAGHGRLVVGPWTALGDDNKLRAHEGQLTIGAKVVMGRDNVVNTYLDVEVGDTTILADWIYVCDFDHRHDRLDIPIKDQGIVASPTRIGPDVWVGEKASVLRGADIGRGAIVASSALVRGEVEPFAIVGGVPARVLKSRLPAGMDAGEAAAALDRGDPIPGDPVA